VAAAAVASAPIGGGRGAGGGSPLLPVPPRPTGPLCNCTAPSIVENYLRAIVIAIMTDLQGVPSHHYGPRGFAAVLNRPLLPSLQAHLYPAAPGTKPLGVVLGVHGEELRDGGHHHDRFRARKVRDTLICPSLYIFALATNSALTTPSFPLSLNSPRLPP
jgi:hypothetical protein